MPVSLTPPMTIYLNNQTITEMYRIDRSSGEYSDIENDEAIYGGGKVKYELHGVHNIEHKYLSSTIA